MADRTLLFRMVENPELDDLRSRNGWRIPPGGAEVKEFWRHREDAERFAPIASALFAESLSLVVISVPDRLLDALELIEPDGGTAYAVRDDRINDFNRAMRFEELPA